MSVAEVRRPGRPSSMREELVARIDEHAPVVHAVYPTAKSTLCSVPVARLGKQLAPDFVPTCLTCRTTAKRFDKIDRSAPALWFRDRGGP
jgi:hypothetical protein